MKTALWRRLATTLAVLATLAAWTTPVGAQAPAATAFLTQSADQRPRALEPDVLRERRVDLNALALGGPATPPAERLFLDLFADVSYTAVRERVVRHDRGLTWHGSLAGLPLSSAVFAVVDGAVAGHVTSPIGQFALTPASGGGYLIQQIVMPPVLEDDAVFPPADPSGTATPPDLGLNVQPLNAASAVVDVLVVYSTAAKVEAGGAAPLEAKIGVAVGLLDTALRAAGTGGARLAGTREVGYAATSDIVTSLLDLQNTSNGVLDEVPAIRDEFQADVVTLVTDSADPDFCGLGYVFVGSGNNTDFAVNVVEQDCVLGLVLAHEVGHNLGLNHDWYTTTNGGLLQSSKGYINLQGRFGTIMAYPGHCSAAGVSCTQITRFSNPSSPHQGFATGVAVGTGTACTAGNAGNPPCDADAANTLTLSAPVVAAYKTSNRLNPGQSLQPGQPVSAPSADCRLEYQGDGNLVAYAAGAPYYASGTGGTSAGSAIMQTDGNFVIYDPDGAAVWATGTSGNPGAYLEVQNDCNVVLYTADAAPLWATGTP